MEPAENDIKFPLRKRFLVARLVAERWKNEILNGGEDLVPKPLAELHPRCRHNQPTSVRKPQIKKRRSQERTRGTQSREQRPHRVVQVID